MRNAAWNRIAVGCWTLGAVLLTAFVAATAWTRWASEESIRAFQAHYGGSADRSAAVAAEPASLDTGDPPNLELWSSSRVRDYELAHVLFSGVAEGVLTIPSVGVRVPVFYGTGRANLAIGAGRIEGTPALGAPGNVGIASHRDGHFRALKGVEIGAAVIVETLHGTYRYEVVDTTVVEPEDVHVLDPTTEPSLTLVTCFPFYFVGNAPQRFIVRARRADAA